MNNNPVTPEDLLPSPILAPKPLEDEQGWDDYWRKKNLGGSLYAFIASILRRYFFLPNLNRLLRCHFPKGAYLLHAGCGSGEVDRDVRHDFRITGVDMSRAALEIYQKNNEGLCQTLHSDLLSLSLPPESVDGIYNLGVLEHFSIPDIERILTQFHRVLKPRGKIVVFWPPEYGLSVFFFKIAVATVKLLTGKEVKFHPDEPSRIRSKEWVVQLISRNGFSVLAFSFGPRDLFTYVSIVAEKTFTSTYSVA